MLSKIAVGTDGSDSASRAVRHAARLAEATGAELVVVHAYGGMAPPDSPTGTRDIGSSLLRDVTSRIADAVPLRSKLEEGDAADVLLSLASQEGADLVVVGNRGMGPKRARIGNVPNRIAHRAPCNVLVAQTTGAPRERTYDRVLIGTDGSETAAAAVEFGSRLATEVGAEVLLLHVGDPARGEAALGRAAAKLPPDARTMSVEGDPAPRIAEVAEAEDCDLIVIGNRGMMGFRRFLASVPSAVLGSAPCHVLLVKTT